MARFLFFVAFYVFLQFGCIDFCLFGPVGGLPGLPFGFARILAGLLRGRPVGIAPVQRFPAGIAFRNAHRLPQFALRHVRRIATGREILHSVQDVRGVRHSD